MISGTHAEYQSGAKSTKDTPYLALTGELWGVFWEYVWENWQRYNGTALYMHFYVAMQAFHRKYIDGLVQSCIISIANALEILQSCTKPATYDRDNIVSCKVAMATRVECKVRSW